MNDEPRIYRPPAAHDAHLRRMFRGLTAFFVTLLVLAVLLILFADRVVALLPFSVEKRFVRPYEEMAGRWFGEALGDAEVEAYLRGLAVRLAAEMDLPEDMTLSVHYLDGGDLNAFATLGGHVFVLRGLVETVPDENSLAMVLAHEIAHIKHRDPVSSLSRGVVLQLILSFVTGNAPQSEELSSFGGQLGLLRYSRKQESRADEDALEALHGLYGHVGGFRSFFESVIRLRGDSDQTPDWLQTHPDLSARIEMMEQWVWERGYSVGPTVPLPEEVRRRIGPNP